MGLPWICPDCGHVVPSISLAAQAGDQRAIELDTRHVCGKPDVATAVLGSALQPSQAAPMGEPERAEQSVDAPTEAGSSDTDRNGADGSGSPKIMKPIVPGVPMDFDQAAFTLGISTRQLKGLWQRREIGAVKVGRLVRFRQSDIDTFCRRNEVRPL